MLAQGTLVTHKLAVSFLHICMSVALLVMALAGFNVRASQAQADLYALGNRVWFDTNNNGRLDGAEEGIHGVTVQLYHADATGYPSGAALATTTTASDATRTGYYLFDNLSAGDYIIVLPASNFSATGHLSGYWSSLTSMQASGAISETTSPGPNTDLDLDDNGMRQTGGPLSGAVSSGVVTLGPSGLSEPTGETDLHSVIGQGVQPDGRANLTVDFGFYRAALGNQVFEDLNDDGLLDTIDLNQDGQPDILESGLSGVTLRLYTSSVSAAGRVEVPVGPDGKLGTADDASGGILTDANGFYQFSYLPQGAYVISASRANYASSQDIFTSAEPDDNVDSDDNGIGPGGVVYSSVVSLAPGATGIQGNNDVSNATGTTLDPTLDFGFIGQVAIGNTLWLDNGAGGGIPANGMRDGTESGIAGVTVQLYTASGGYLAATTSDANGHYQFDQLHPGSYSLFIPPTQFQPGGKLAGELSSPGAGANQSYDETVDENGINTGDPDVNGVGSSVFYLWPGAEVKNENQASYTGALPDDSVNFTADLGFAPEYALGNRVWLDINNNARLDAGEPGMDGVTLELYFADNAGSATASTGMVTTTAHGGYYLFEVVQPGRYVVAIQASNFAPGGRLAGYWSSQTSLTVSGPGAEMSAPGPDNDLDLDDNGMLNTQAGVLPVGAVAAQALALGDSPEPVGEIDVDGSAPGAQHQGYSLDPHANMTVDFGFFTAYALGNRVWYDLDNSATLNSIVINKVSLPEQGIDGVSVALYRDEGAGSYTLVGTTTTANGGYYLFNYIPTGNYVVVLPAANFSGAGKLVGYHSSGTSMLSRGALSETAAPAPNNNGPDGIPGTADDDIDSDDNGARQSAGPFAGAVVSGGVTLGPAGNTEPAGESDLDAALSGDHQGQPDSLANMKVDFGFYRAALGDLVFLDLDNNGQLGTGEPGIAAATVRLYAVDSAGLNRVEVPVGPDGQLGTSDDAPGGMLTNASGFYQFSNLPQGEYVVSVNAAVPARSSAIDSANPDDNIDGDDNGLGKDMGVTFSGVLTLAPGSAGLGGNNIQDFGTGTMLNPTLDFAFIQVTTATTTTLTVVDHPTVVGVRHTFTATVSAASGTAAGTVTFKDGANVLGTVPLVNGLAILDAPPFTVGAHTVSAEYNGDGSFADSLSNTLNIQAKAYIVLPLIHK
jgi:hypothetical protein